ncbi:MAG: cupin domain-containing protein [Sulfuricurvum sp.]|uniref:cupin domain-containing protein n=1 Tax=Sulfuricurvum sp. TaxID=2025608 RepID=UPI0025D5AF4A|nr:cupin domain-containing protein [Sulfuricurvum sp.]MBV5320596.1 cupin domain-containing protein [Sulfuricurvum sp.]
MIRIANLSDLNEPTENNEIFLPLFQTSTFKIEAIRSWLKIPGELYNQEEDEWVILLEGKASIEMDNQIFTLQKGDYFFIPKHRVHRILSTSKNALWIGVFSF